MNAKARDPWQGAQIGWREAGERDRGREGNDPGQPGLIAREGSGERAADQPIEQHRAEHEAQGQEQARRLVAERRPNASEGPVTQITAPEPPGDQTEG